MSASSKVVILIALFFLLSCKSCESAVRDQKKNYDRITRGNPGAKLDLKKPWVVSPERVILEEIDRMGYPPLVYLRKIWETMMDQKSGPRSHQ